VSHFLLVGLLYQLWHHEAVSIRQSVNLLRQEEKSKFFTVSLCHQRDTHKERAAVFRLIIYSGPLEPSLNL